MARWLAMSVCAWSASGCGDPRPPAADAAVTDAVVDATSQRDAELTGCAAAARWIYLADANGNLLRFEPDRDVITEVGRMACTDDGTKPFSMAVHADARALVAFGDQRVHEVTTTDARCGDAWDAPYHRFGMGFVGSDGGDQLFIASAAGTLAAVDLTTWSPRELGDIGGAAELTGNALGELWAFTPTATTATVRQLDTRTGATLVEHDVGPTVNGGTPGAAPAAWAFAYWGGRFYIFYLAVPGPDDSSSIFRFTPDTAEVELMRRNVGHVVVGAGVSTCAPTDFI
ncbi:MAG: hypothetical protein KF901_20590 [Myxococcales bacterium]|nr:hypothetical protein [Myxococcales bacterium]